MAGPAATRVVSVAPSITELVYAAGAGDMLVAVSAYSDYPPQAKKLPVVADAAGIAFESLLSLRPDLVLTWKGGTREADVARLKALNIRVQEVEVVELADLGKSLREIGRWTGREVEANAAAGALEKRLEELRKTHVGRRLVRTFFELATMPLLTINHRHFLSEAMKLCGAENVFADAPQMVVEPSREALLARGADLVLYTRAERGRAFDPAPYRGLAAQREKRMQGLTADYVLRPGPRLVEGVAEICRAVDEARADLPAPAGR